MIIIKATKDGLEAWGDASLKIEDMLKGMDAPQLSLPRGITFELSQEVNEVEDGFFVLIHNIDRLVIKNPDCNISLNEETLELFHKNNVLLSGPFDGVAERLAKEHGLRFMHTDMFLAAGGDFYSRSGCDRLFLNFNKDGSAYICHRNDSEGFGGERRFDLEADFYSSMNVESVAKEYGGKYADEILQNHEFIVFMQKAQAKGGYFIDYENTMKIGYQGDIYSNSFFAADVFIEKNQLNNVEKLPLLNSLPVLKAVAEGSIKYGIVAYQNTVTGLVEETSKALSVFEESLELLDEIRIPIHHSLFICKEDSEDGNSIKTIYSHEQALKQCSRYLNSQYPQAALMQEKDTAMAAIKLSKGKYPKGSGVICRKECGEYLKLFLVAYEIEDESDNSTIFHIYRKKEDVLA